MSLEYNRVSSEMALTEDKKVLNRMLEEVEKKVRFKSKKRIERTREIVKRVKLVDCFV